MISIEFLVVTRALILIRSLDPCEDVNVHSKAARLVYESEYHARLVLRLQISIRHFCPVSNTISHPFSCRHISGWMWKAFGLEQQFHLTPLCSQNNCQISRRRSPIEKELRSWECSAKSIVNWIAIAASVVNFSRYYCNSFRGCLQDGVRV